MKAFLNIIWRLTTFVFIFIQSIFGDKIGPPQYIEAFLRLIAFQIIHHHQK